MKLRATFTVMLSLAAGLPAVLLWSANNHHYHGIDLFARGRLERHQRQRATLSCRREQQGSERNHGLLRP